MTLLKCLESKTEVKQPDIPVDDSPAIVRDLNGVGFSLSASVRDLDIITHKIHDVDIYRLRSYPGYGVYRQVRHEVNISDDDEDLVKEHISQAYHGVIFLNNLEKQVQVIHCPGERDPDLRIPLCDLDEKSIDALIVNLLKLKRDLKNDC